MFATTVVEITCGSGETPPSQAVAGTGVSGSVDTVLPVPAALDAAADEPLTEALLVEDGSVDAPQEDAARQSRPPSAAERRAWLAEHADSSFADMTETYHSVEVRASSVPVRERFDRSRVAPTRGHGLTRTSGIST
ncbi:MAG TPA: hypothetical protein VEK07_14020 [Polyangiaceae bacterium]|nr:hypothetical protein [Polyangiaceae bacterium]